MEWLNKFNLKPAQLFKALGLAFIVVILVAIAIRLIGSSIDSVKSQKTQNQMFNLASSFGGAVEDINLSYRNAAGSMETSLMPPYYNGTSGNDAEAFEVKDYQAVIETRKLTDTCGAIGDLKDREDVIFESSSQYERGCNFSFKVTQASVSEVLNFIKEFKPDELNENTRTIKNQVQDFTSQEKILENKLVAIDETLDKAIRAYDEVTALAIKAQDAGSLAKIIDSKVNIIERLTQERISISAQLEQLNQRKSNQLDRLAYTYFNVSVRENIYVDGERLKDSWRVSVQQFVRDINKIAQDVSVNLVVIILLVVQYLLYFFIFLFTAKYVWRATRRLWRS